MPRFATRRAPASCWLGPLLQTVLVDGLRPRAKQSERNHDRGGRNVRFSPALMSPAGTRREELIDESCYSTRLGAGERGRQADLRGPGGRKPRRRRSAAPLGDQVGGDAP